jgi:2-isopropylmalate synthase
MTKDILLYDTTLRDGTQGEEVSFSAEDKLRIVKRLDELGFDYVEGGWPGSNPKDARFFEMARNESFRTARLTAFGSTCRAGTAPENDQNIKALLKAETESVTIFGKSWDLHASEILGITLDENLRIIEQSIAWLKGRDREVIFDAEHFFDGFRDNKDYALQTLTAALNGGADMVVLCDTNGGSLPDQIREITADVIDRVSVKVGIHTHNDGGLALSNSLSAVNAGAIMVQGTINGYGERCGNADLISVIGNLQLKMGRQCLDPENIVHLTELSHYVSEVANIPPLNQRPFAGKSAFAHKGGIHVSAIQKNPRAYEHMEPELIGNHRRVIVSDLSGKSNIEYKAREMGIKIDSKGSDSKRIVEKIKAMEDRGYQFDAAEGSLELLMKKASGQFEEPFALESFRVTIEKDKSGASSSHATIKISVGDEHEITAAEGHGPVNALDHALRKALNSFFPQIKEMGLVDFKVRVVEGSDGTAAQVLVRIESRDSHEVWSTVGVSEDIIEASWLALMDSVQYKLLKEMNRAEDPPKP